MADINIGVLEGVLSLKDVFTGVLQGASKSMAKFKSDFESMVRTSQSQSEALSKKMTGIGEGISKAGQSLLGMSVMAGAAGAGVVKLTSDFESSFAGVRKTVNATEAELTKLSNGFREMAKTIPVNVNELNNIGAAAGQLGIKTENILGFTRVMADLGVATNLSSEEAATQLARFANITQMSQKDFDRLGSTIVALGNNFATTEAEITAMSMRIAGAGAQIGMSESQILAIGTALSSVGIEAEAGGSAISKVMIDMAMAVSQGGDQLTRFANASNMSVSQFKTLFQDDAAGALNAFIQGLGQMKQSGGDVLGTLANMGIEEVRMRDALLRASGAGDLLTRSLSLSAQAWKDNTALTKEAEQRYATFSSQVTILWNRLKDVGIQIGLALLPTLKSMISAMDPVLNGLKMMAEWFGKLPTPIRVGIAAVVALAAALAPLLIVVGQVVTAIGTLAGLGVTGAMIVTFGKVALVVGAVVAAFYGAGKLLSALGEATGAFDVLSRWGRTLYDGFGKIFERIGAPLWASFKDMLFQIQSAASEVWGAFTGLLRPLVQGTGSLITMEGVVKALNIVFGVMATQATIVMKVIQNVAWAYSQAAGAVRSLIDNINALRGVQNLPDPGKPAGLPKAQGYTPDVSDEAINRGNAMTRQLEMRLGLINGANNALGDGNKKLQEAKEKQEALNRAAIEMMETRVKTAEDYFGVGAEDVGNLMNSINFMEKMGGLSKLSKEQTEALNKSLDKVLTGFKRMGHEGPKAWTELYVRTKENTVVMKSLTIEAQNQIAELGKIPPKVNLVHAAFQKLSTEQQVGVVHYMQLYISLLEKASPLMADLVKRATGLSGAKPPAQKAGVDIGKSIGDGLKNVFSDLPKTISDAFTGGGGLVGAFKAVGTQLADVIVRPMVLRIKELTAAQQGAIGAGTAAAGAMGGAFGGSTGAMIATTASTIGGAALATTALGVAAKTSMAAMIGLSAATLGIGLAAVGVYLLAKKFFTVSKEVKQAREDVKKFQEELWKTMNPMQVAEAAGRGWAASLITVRDAYVRMGRSAGEAERLVGEMLDTKHPDKARAAMSQINDVVGTFRQILGRANEQMGTLLEQSLELGVRLPDSLLESLARMRDLGDLSAENVKLLEKLMGAPEVDYKKFEEAANRYKINPDALGIGYQQSKTTSAAQQMIDDFDLLTRGGASVGTVLHGMREELSKLASDAIKYGTALPENMKPWIEELARSGQLLDENGEAMTGLGKIKWTESLETSMSRVADSIQKLVDMLNGPLTNALGGKKTLDVDINVNENWDRTQPVDRGGDEPEYATGTMGVHGRWFGRFSSKGTRARLHGTEAVITPEQAPAFAADVLGMSTATQSGASSGGGIVPIVMRIKNHQVFAEVVLEETDHVLALSGVRR